jgi:hypothetical protein
MLGNKKLKKKQSSMDHSSTISLRKKCYLLFSHVTLCRNLWENTESAYIELFAREAEELRQMILAQILSSEARERRKLDIYPRS